MASVAAINSLGSHAHNPRGNLWFNDESTYGHKLLMKMGWNKGKGLGKNENGIKENLKVKVRGTNSGLGFKDDSYTNVMKTEYESILKNLAAEYSYPGITNSNEINGNSKEEPTQKSKVVKSKLRYPKLFFGKDVTKYSEKDMKSIFICSTPLKSIEDEKKISIIAEDKNSSENEPPKAFDTFSSSLSISDYFAKKMEEKRSNTLNKNIGNAVIHRQTSLEFDNIDSSAVTIKEGVTSKTKQKDSFIDMEKSDGEQLNKIISESKKELTGDMHNEKPSKKKKKKSEKSVGYAEINSSESESIVSNIKHEDTLDKSMHNDILNDNNTCVIDNITNQNYIRPNKKRKRSQVFENSYEEPFETISETSSSLSPSKKKRKSSKINFPTVQSFLENSVQNNSPLEIYDDKNSISDKTVEESSTNKELKQKKKSKKKLKEKLKSCLKSKHASYSFKNISFNETVFYRIIDSDTESVEPLACNNSDEDTIFCEITDDDNKANENTNSAEKITTNDINPKDDICENGLSNASEDSDEGLKLSDLPSSKSSHYNAWVESQRQALKMQLYKKMLKSIKNNKTLKTTNLLSIKGYGNWGFQ